MKNRRKINRCRREKARKEYVKTNAVNHLFEKHLSCVTYLGFDEYKEYNDKINEEN